MSYKIFGLYPEDCNLIRSIDLSALTRLIPGIKLQPDQKKYGAPLRLKIPDELEKAIRRVTKLKTKRTDHKYLYVLLAAARCYRDKYPIPDGWKEPDRDSYAKAERDRRQEEDVDLNRKKIVLRLPPKDRELLLNLGRGRQDIITRHEALCELASIVKGLDDAGVFEIIKKHTRKSYRINVPDELETAILQRASDSEAFLTILLAAARAYYYG
jgi:hypothetical protein